MLTPLSNHDLRRTLCLGAWFKNLPPALQDGLLAQGRFQPMENGQRVYLQGDSCDGLYAVLSGAVLMRCHAEDGRESLLALIDAPHWFGEISLIDNGPRPQDVHARGETLLWWLPRSVMDDWLMREPALWQHIAQLATGKMRLLFRKMEDLALLSAQERLISELLALSERYGLLTDPSTSPRVVPINQEQLAAMLSISRQTVSEVMSQLLRSGAVRRLPGGLEVVQPEALRRMLLAAGGRQPA